MRTFLQGLVLGACVSSSILMAVFSAIYFTAPESAESFAKLAAMFVALVGGYVYKVKNGAFLYADDGVERSATRLAFFLLGCGAVLGPFKTLIVGNVFRDFPPLLGLALLGISVPLSGMSVLGPMLAGSLFRRRKN